jgi:hypothetical protein
LNVALPPPIAFESHRDFVRDVLRSEAQLTAVGPDFLPFDKEPTDGPSARQRAQLNSEGSPSDTVALGYVWTPGTELSRRGPQPINNGDGRSVSA